MKCEICGDSDLEVVVSAHSREPFIDGRTYDVICHTCYAVPRSWKYDKVSEEVISTSTRLSTVIELVEDGWSEEHSKHIALLERAYAAATYQTCLQKGAICIDLYNDLEKVLSEKHFYDPDHNTPAGTRLIGNYLGQKLLPTIGKRYPN